MFRMNDFFSEQGKPPKKAVNFMTSYKKVGGGQFKSQLIYIFNSGMGEVNMFHIKAVSKC